MSGPSAPAPLQPSAILKQLFLMSWLWAVFAGFYLVAYVFWVPHLFANLAVVVVVGAVTFVLGASLLADGFGRALQLQTSQPPQLQVPFLRLRRLLGGIVLLGYILVYLPPSGRIVAHWPLDLAITVVAGIVMVVYAVVDQG